MSSQERRNIKLVLEYDGTNYHGWQTQKDLITIQSSLEKALLDLTGQKTNVSGSGRTDAGVHAYKQVANFYTTSSIPAHAFAKALNSVLPPDIVIKESEEVSLDFHAQFSAKAKAYSYRIYNNPIRPAIERNYTHWVWYTLDLAKMKEASLYLIGTHDFTSFEAADSPRKSNIRTINCIDIKKEGWYITIMIEADGFLYRMVRNIVGTLIEIGHKEYLPDHIKMVLEATDRKLCGPTIPAKGLFLEYVKY